MILCFSYQGVKTVDGEFEDNNAASMPVDKNDIDGGIIESKYDVQSKYHKSNPKKKSSEIKQCINRSRLDPCVFAPTGDIYSYFNRRPMLSSSAATFQYPFRYSCVQALKKPVSLYGN